MTSSSTFDFFNGAIIRDVCWFNLDDDDDSSLFLLTQYGDRAAVRALWWTAQPPHSRPHSARNIMMNWKIFFLLLVSLQVSKNLIFSHFVVFSLSLTRSESFDLIHYLLEWLQQRFLFFFLCLIYFHFDRLFEVERSLVVYTRRTRLMFYDGKSWGSRTTMRWKMWNSRWWSVGRLLQRDAD